MTRMTVRKTGTPSRPWEARCADCTDEHVHLVPGFGAVAVNTRGMGNRLWVLAMLAVQEHRRACHSVESPSARQGHSAGVIVHDEAERLAVWGELDPPGVCMCADCVLRDRSSS